MASLPCDDPLPGMLQQPLPEEVENGKPKNHSYAQILKSSALIGGSQVLNIAIGIVRTKAMAMLLGPGGFGLAGLYNSVADITQNIAGMGINSSGVRQIAEAVGSEETERIARTAAVLRRTAVALGFLGALLLVVFSRQVSTLTFGDSRHAYAICLLSIAVFFKSVSAGQGALIQGMRRIADLAKMGVLGGFFGTLVSIPVIYVFREQGVVPSLVAIAAMTLLTSWWYSRKLRTYTPPISVFELRQEVAPLLKLGFVFMASGLMTLGVAYAIRITVLHKLGYEATGLYQSSWTLGGLYVGFILQAMGADFYPRLTASANDNATCNRLVNEQAHVGLLLACPGVIATLTFAPIVVALFYSAKFSPAVGLLRWICLGATMQVVSWPMGFIIVAKGRQNLFFFCELAWAIVSLGLAWTCVRSFGLNGTGIAFFGSYVFHALLLYPIVKRLSGFSWSADNLRTGGLLLALIGAVFCGILVLPLSLAVCIGVPATLLSAYYSISVLAEFVSLDRIPRPIRQLIVGLGFASSNPTAD